MSSHSWPKASATGRSPNGSISVEAHVTQVLQKLKLYETPDQHRRVLAVLAYLRS